MNRPHLSLISGTEMLRETLHGEVVAEVKTDNRYVKIEYMGQTLYIEQTETTGLVISHLTGEGDHVFVVLKNGDFTEGRGPMAFHKVFRSYVGAFEYVMSKEGIFGSKQGVNNYSGVNIYGKPYVVSGFNGYEIRVAKAED